MVLTSQQIQAVCNYAIDKVPMHISRYKDVLDIMNVTGIRISEALNVNLWTFYSPDVWILKPNKESNQRTFNTNIFPASWKTKFADTADPIHEITYRKMQYYLDNLLQPYNLKVGVKYILAHLYRHNYAKALQAEGYSEADIQINMGHKQLSSTQYYLNSVITASSLPA